MRYDVVAVFVKQLKSQSEHSLCSHIVVDSSVMHILFCLKVVVIITDDRSSSTDEEIRAAAKPLENKGIHVIAVGVGSVPQSEQLEQTTQNKEDVITARKDVDPAVLGNKIMERAFKRKNTTQCYYVYHIN